MEVAILYSGGKDSTNAIAKALENGWNIKYLLSVKPTRTDCYLFHFATVEHTRTLANILGLPHILTTCDVADPVKEALIVKEVVKKHPVDAVILGGSGLQETQIKSVREALFDLGVETFASHQGDDHGELVEDLLEKDYKIIITQIAAEGLNQEWLGKILTKASYEELKQRSEKFGFHNGGEGGHFDTLCVDGPLFTKKLEILEAEKIMESNCVGYLKINKLSIVDKKECLVLNH